MVEELSEGMSAYHVGLSGLEDLVASKSLTADELREVRRELEILEATLPPASHTISNESLCIPFQGFDGEDFYLGKLNRINAWRYGFSRRLLFTEWAAEVERLLAPAIFTDSMPWADVQATFRRIKTDLENMGVRLIGQGDTFSGWELFSFHTARYRRTILARIRLLMTACSFLSNGHIPELIDPFGSKLLSSTVDGRLKAWSVGPNGIDDGGVGSWKGEEPLDLVLECSR